MRIVAWGFLTLIIGITLVVLTIYIAGAYVFSIPPDKTYTGVVSDHFNGTTFFNPNMPPRKQSGFLFILKWRFLGERAEWKWIENKSYPAPPTRSEKLRVTFINHATVLIQVDGLNILTDPIWSNRASPVSFMGPKRYRAPGVAMSDLPPIDLILISHNHYDHFDIPTLKTLISRDNPKIIMPIGNKVILNEAKLNSENVTELDWWEHSEFKSIKITQTPAQHFAARGLKDRNKSLWGSFMIQSTQGNIYFGGDSGFGDFYKEIYARFDKTTFAILPIGAYKPEWFMRPVHMNPKEAVDAFKELHATYGMGIHFGTFPLADDSQQDPINDLEHALLKSNLKSDQFWVLGFGESRLVP